MYSPPTPRTVATVTKAREHALAISRLLTAVQDDVRGDPRYADVFNDANRLADDALSLENKLTVMHIEETGLLAVANERGRKR